MERSRLELYLQHIGMHMNYIKLQDVMTTNEASYRWNINESTLRMRIKNSPIIDELKTQGLIKYFLKPGNKRGEYLFTVEAMERLYGKEKKIIESPQCPPRLRGLSTITFPIQKG